MSTWGRRNRLPGRLQEGTTTGDGAGDPGGVYRHGTVRNGNVRNLGDPAVSHRFGEYADRMGRTLRRANSLLEVGLADSTLSAGEPRTWGSGEAGVNLIKGHIDHTQRWSNNANKTRQDNRESESRCRAAFHILGACADPGIPYGDLEADEPTRSRWSRSCEHERLCRESTATM